MSPVRHQKTVYRGRSPPHYRSRSRSPPHHQSRSYNPSHRRSRSLSPSRVLGRSWSTSWHESKSRSPSRPQSRSCSPVKPQSRSCFSEQSQSISHSPQPVSGSHSLAEPRSRSHSPAQRQSRSRSIVHERQQDVGDIYADLDKEFDGETEAILSPKSAQNDQNVVENITLSEIQAHITRNLLSPPTQMLKDILETAKDKKSKDSPPKQENHEGPLSPNENVEIDEVDLDLEEVGEEVDDIFAKSIIRSVEDSIGSAFEEGLQRGKRKREFQVGSNPSPPKTKSLQKLAHDCDIGYHTDWEIKTALGDPPKPLEKQIQAPAPSKVLAGVSKSNNSSLWTQALDHHQGQESKLKMIYQSGASDWEVETPYVGR